jgi:hypothetical protein
LPSDAASGITADQLLPPAITVAREVMFFCRRITDGRIARAADSAAGGAETRKQMTVKALFSRRIALAVLAGIGVSASAAAAETPAAAWVKHTAGSTRTVDHSAWDGLLKAHLVQGADGLNRIAYARFKPDHGKLKAYVAKLEATDTTVLDRPEQWAFWANLYNAKTIDVVLDRYPVKSIKDVSLGGGLKSLVGGGPWQAKIMKVAGQAMSLDDIENVVMRPTFKDPRVHYSVNCASIGCPNVPAQALTGANLETQLDAGAKAFINSPRGIVITGGKAKASSIYDWFRADFGGTDAAVIAHMKKYAAPALKAELDGITAISDHGYDWALADAK